MIIVRKEDHRAAERIERIFHECLPLLKKHYEIDFSRLEVNIREDEPSVSGMTFFIDDTGMSICRLNCIRNRSTLEIVKTIGHEFTHLEQFATKQVQYHGADSILWNGKVVKLHDSDENYNLYYFQPWEIAARRRADEFVMHFIRSRQSFISRLWLRILHLMR